MSTRITVTERNKSFLRFSILKGVITTLKPDRERFLWSLADLSGRYSQEYLPQDAWGGVTLRENLGYLVYSASGRRGGTQLNRTVLLILVTGTHLIQGYDTCLGFECLVLIIYPSKGSERTSTHSSAVRFFPFAVCWRWIPQHVHHLSFHADIVKFISSTVSTIGWISLFNHKHIPCGALPFGQVHSLWAVKNRSWPLRGNVPVLTLQRPPKGMFYMLYNIISLCLSVMISKWEW